MPEAETPNIVAAEKNDFLPLRKFDAVLRADRKLPFVADGCLAVLYRALSDDPDHPTFYSEVVFSNIIQKENTEKRVVWGLNKLRENNQSFVDHLPENSPADILIQTYGSEILCDPRLSPDGDPRHSFAILRGEYVSKKRDSLGPDYYSYLVTGNGKILKIGCQSTKGTDVRAGVNLAMEGTKYEESAAADFLFGIDLALLNGPLAPVEFSCNDLHFWAKEINPLNSKTIDELNKMARSAQRRAITVAYSIGIKNNADSS